MMQSADPLSGHRVVLGLTAGELSGVDIFCANLLRGLQRHHVPCHVVHSRPRRAWNPMPTAPDLPVKRLGEEEREPWGARWDRMRRYLESQAPCVYVPNYDYEYSCIVPRLSSAVRVVGIVHSDDPNHYEHLRRMGRFWDGVVAVSSAVATRALELAPGLEDRLVTIPYGVPVAAAMPERSPRETLRVVYTGRLQQAQKRVLDLASIFRRIAEIGAPVELTIVGDGESRDELAHACEGLLAQGVVKMLGTLPNEGVLEIFEQNDVLLLTSAFEGLPVALLEAMGRGCVPVVSDIRSGVREVIEDGENGLLAPVGDIETFVSHLQTLQANRSRLRAMSQAAYRTIRRGGYDVSTMVDRYLEVFARAISRPRRSDRLRSWRRIPYPETLSQATWKDQLPVPLREFCTRTMHVLRRGLLQSRAR